MRALALQLRVSRPSPGDAVAILLLATQLWALIQLILEGPTWTNAVIILAPLLLVTGRIFKRRPLTPVQRTVALVGAAISAAVLTTLVILVAWVTVLVLPVMGVAAVVFGRFPASSVVLTFVLAGVFGSLEAFVGLSAQQSVDVIIGGLWLAAIWTWVVGGRERSLWLWPAVVVLLAYVVISAIEMIGAERLFVGLQSFRASIWYLGAGLLVALAPWPEGTRRRALRGVVAMILAIGAYATLRWIFGPAAAERELGQRAANNYLDGELRPIGSFATSKELAAWMAMTIPFAAGLALTLRGRWRAVAAAAVVASIVGMLAADVRAGPAAAVPGLVLVLVLYQLAAAWRGRRGATAIVAMAATALVGAAAFGLTLGENADTGARYQAILDPTSDASYQARLIKWRTAIDDIDTAPLGHGLGTSGRVQKRYGRITNIGSIDVDNAYIKVAYEQGFPLLALWAGGLLFLLVGLIRRATADLDPARAGPAIAGCGTLVAMLVLFFIGDYVEGLPALGGWICVGLGLSGFVQAHPADVAGDRDAVPAST